jgi:ribonuclease BN (tRNA processing enzyme)
MRVTVIGCSGSFPGPDSPASSYLIEADGYAMLLDFGSGALGSLQRYHPLYDIDAVCVSHLHPDHCMDLCGYYVARRYCPDGVQPRIPVYGPRDTGPQMARAYGLEGETGMSEAFDFRCLREGPQEIGPFSVTTSLMNHPIEAYGFRIEHEGKVLAYSGDTGTSDVLVELAKNADLFLCEASFVNAPDLPSGVHLTGRDAGEYAARAGVDRLVLTHLVPWNDPAEVLIEAKDSDFRGEISLAHPGARHTL